MKTLSLALTLLLALASYATAEEVDTSPLNLKPARAFPNLRVRRPVVITHAGDNTNRLFIVTQQGVIHVIPNDQKVEETKTFLDIEEQVVYHDKQNEEGLLGLAFHPKYAENGEFFVYYTTKDAPQTSVISRFRVSQNDPGKADPESEEEILRIKQPFWNHNGGALEFGPDGYLYIGLGDGGSANDPQGNGQNLSTLLGSILRIDIDKKQGDLNYAIPADNPFVNNKDARGEIYAYGLRNVWGLDYDLQTGLFWAADVGQNLWEEIDLIEKGGNYGWSLREGLHPFGENGVEKNGKMIDPIWEYHHETGKSVTGGKVYHGNRLPELADHYLYADYVSGKIWALKYDAKRKKVVANRSIKDEKMPIIAFGRDQNGEVYFSDAFGQLYWFDK